MKLMTARKAASGPPGDVLERIFSQARHTRYEDDAAEIAGSSHVSIDSSIRNP